MTIRELLNRSVKKLSKSTSPQLDAEVLLSHVLDKPKEYLFTNPNKEVSSKQEKQFKILMNRRKLGWPVAYLQSQKEFFGLKFYVDKNVLIPRPETEGLVEMVLKAVSNDRFQVSGSKPFSILDIGTGSGAIIIVLAKTLTPNPPYLFWASDISKTALAVARRNAKFHKVKVTFKQGSLLGPWKNQKFDIVVANLPYLERETDESTKYEPRIALIAQKKGLDLIETLLKQVSTLNAPPSTLILEIGHNQASAIKKLANKYLPAFETKISKDLSGKIRYAWVQKLS